MLPAEKSPYIVTVRLKATSTTPDELRTCLLRYKMSGAHYVQKFRCNVRFGGASRSQVSPTR